MPENFSPLICSMPLAPPRDCPASAQGLRVKHPGVFSWPVHPSSWLGQSARRTPTLPEVNCSPAGLPHARLLLPSLPPHRVREGMYVPTDRSSLPPSCNGPPDKLAP